MNMAVELLDLSGTTVRQFCRTHGIEDEAGEAWELVKSHFPSDSTISLRVDDDPETDGEWLVFDVSSSAPVDTVLHCYDAFLTEWTAAAPPEVDKLIRVTLNLS